MGLFVLKESDEPIALLKAALANLKISKRLKIDDYLVTNFAIPYLEAAIDALENKRKQVSVDLCPEVTYDDVDYKTYRSLTTKPLSSILEPKSQYDWSSVPQSYDWLATNQDGTVKAFKSKPIIIGLGWISPSTSAPVTVLTSGYKGCWKFSREMRV